MSLSADLSHTNESAEAQTRAGRNFAKLSAISINQSQFNIVNTLFLVYHAFSLPTRATSTVWRGQT